jgi:acid phosphatase type 7
MSSHFWTLRPSWRRSDGWRRSKALLVASLVISLCAGSCSGNIEALIVPLQPVVPPFGDTRSVLIVAAGDLASPEEQDSWVAQLLMVLPFERFLTLGDNAYRHGTREEFDTWWHPVFGHVNDRVCPSPGNHDYDTPAAAGYKSYFNQHAPCYPASADYYAVDVGGWRWYSLNSEIAADTASAQYKWLAAELASNSARCVGAYWHWPMFNAGVWGTGTRMQPIWSLLSSHGASLVLTGHDHDYQRWLPIDGITQFVVGTGGASSHELAATPSDARVAAQAVHIFGVLQLALYETRADFRFVTVSGRVLDSGGVDCPASD